MKSFNIPDFYRSDFISKIKTERKKSDPRKQDFSPTEIRLKGLTLILARHFGFCYGVENAIERAYAALRENPGKRILLLSQMIHNPAVNADLQENGIDFIMDTEGNQLIAWDEVSHNDVVLIPAFGTTIEIEQLLISKGIDIQTYNTTCPFVEKVWNRSEKLSTDRYTIIIHGKPNHEETRATFSHASSNGPAVVVKNMKEAELLADFMRGKRPIEEFLPLFGKQVSASFDPKTDLNRVGVVNQTTMLASETQAIADFFKSVMEELHGKTEVKHHFADTRDTLCYATNDNQQATFELLKSAPDLAIVVGGYNSSNTSHIVDLLAEACPTYFVKDENELVSASEIQHFNYHSKTLLRTNDWLALNKPLRVVITSGASCPDAVLQAVMFRLMSFYPDIDRQELDRWIAEKFQ